LFDIESFNCFILFFSLIQYYTDDFCCWKSYNLTVSYYQLSLNFFGFAQKYRLHTRRPSPSNNESANSQTAAPFVLVGNIFVQQQEYGGVASSTTSGEMTKVVAPSGGIYAPVATHPPPAATIKKPEFKKFDHSISEERANNNSEGAVHSNSPTSSSSTHNTTNTSLGY
jgi:hypothetical protein